MTRAEEAALKAYPVHSVLIRPARQGGYYADNHLRSGYIKGYEQAEKDLADAFQSEYAKELARADSLTGEDGFKKFSESVRALVEAVEGYIAPKKGDKYVFRNEVLEKCNKVKKLLGE